jgi:hypothetical protein
VKPLPLDVQVTLSDAICPSGRNVPVAMFGVAIKTLGNAKGTPFPAPFESRARPQPLAPIQGQFIWQVLVPTAITVILLSVPEILEGVEPGTGTGMGVIGPFAGTKFIKGAQLQAEKDRYDHNLTNHLISFPLILSGAVET